MSECGSTFLYLKKKFNGMYNYAFVPARCRSWSCPVCRPIKAAQLRRYVGKHFTGENIFMLSFTLYHSGSAADSWGYISDHWNRLRTSVVKNSGRFTFMRIIEPHADGRWPHMHVLIHGSKQIYELLTKCTDCGFGWSCHSLRVSTDRAKRYVTKYLTKPWPGSEADSYRILKKTRIVSVSRDLPPLFTKESEWECVQDTQPNNHVHFRANSMIDYLQNHGATYICCEPFADGFNIQTDMDVDMSGCHYNQDPYIWDHCTDYNYEFIEYGLQQTLDLSNYSNNHGVTDGFLFTKRKPLIPVNREFCDR